ncbi:unnamed protein product [Heterotrigona itama]|uniref:Uncharacterized protein n=1 Tax=Heterotrigona itama TaxID=395501 RepID=A0A6V7H3N3_9HYME|nr:unnamed protein product [Heterotrigona itama]
MQLEYSAGGGIQKFFGKYTEDRIFGQVAQELTATYLLFINISMRYESMMSKSKQKIVRSILRKEAFYPELMMDPRKMLMYGLASGERL